MTTDPFTEAARAEAEDYARIPRMNVGTVRDRLAEAYLAGAVWQASQEPTDAECTAVLNSVTTPLGEEPKDGEWFPAAIQRCREVMMSARAARRDEEKRDD